MDWSWSEHAVCVVDDTGAALERVTVRHTAAGLRKLVTALHKHQVAGVAIERGDGPVVAALLEAGLTVFLIVPQQVTALRSRYSTARNKDDRFDAYLLADVLRTDRRRLTPLTVDTDATVGLRMLIRTRADLVKARVAAHNQLRAHLQLAHPGVVGLFHQLDGKISLAFLTRFPTPRHARWLSDKRLAAWLKAAHYTRLTTRTAGQLFDHLTQAPAGHPDGPAADAAQVITLELVALLTNLRERILRSRPTSRPRSPRTQTPRCSPACPAPEPSAPRPCSPRSATPAAATPPTTPSPPQPASPPPPARPGARTTSRSAAAATTGYARPSSTSPTPAAHAHPWAQDVYARARGRGHNHAHAVRVLARAWLRIIWRCWTDHTPYDLEHHATVLAARTARVSPSDIGEPVAALADRHETSPGVAS
ncbi:MAG: IS110 family transposase [Pseudonocardia sp. SCN 72-86]|nr:MAG: IS110 family transposase [Pseudonocardia sp. SCN 72-86]